MDFDLELPRTRAAVRLALRDERDSLAARVCLIEEIPAILRKRESERFQRIAVVKERNNEARK